APRSPLVPYTTLFRSDVLQADGGTRTASITGAFVALMDAVMLLRRTGAVSKLPIREFLAATSAGIVDGVPTLDLTFAEDSRARRSEEHTSELQSHLNL